MEDAATTGDPDRAGGPARATIGHPSHRTRSRRRSHADPEIGRAIARPGIRRHRRPLRGPAQQESGEKPEVLDRPQQSTKTSRAPGDSQSKGQQGSESGEEKRQGDGQGGGTSALAFPTGDRGSSVLLVETQTPKDVRVGHEFTYTIRLTNLTDAIVLEDVRLSQQVPDNLEIERSEPSQAQAAAGGVGGAGWSFDRIGPGESKTIEVTAIAGSMGTARSCFRAQYSPALCVATDFVKPQISLTKQAPDTTDICNPFTFKYAIKNEGTASAKGLKIRDKLPEGLVTADGKDAVTFDLGELAEGESKEFEAEIRANKTGSFASRAVATGQDDIKVQSKKTATRVRQAVLAVDIGGPEATYIDEPSTYDITVKNEGDAPARETTLEVQLADNAKLIKARAAGEGQGDRAETSQGQLTWKLGTLEPGASRTFKVTATGQAKGELKHTAIARSACARDADREELRQAATARAEATTEILTLPALLLSAIDQDDPIRVGEVETYLITVVNQGTGADENVQITAELPENYEYVDVEGPTGAKADGQTITFDPVDRLAPGDRVRWKLRAKATSEGDVQLRVDLTSGYLSQPAISTEPTRLFK